MLKKIISIRSLIQGLAGIALFLALSYFKISLIYVILIGSFLGLVFGKVFCRWICPIGFLVELMMKFNKNGNAEQLYMYHKMGCPIAWISGYFNRFSLFKVRKDDNKCISCGKCDKACYITSLNQEFSFYKKDKKNPTLNYSCSKCLQCVGECPTKSLTYSLK